MVTGLKEFGELLKRGDIVLLDVREVNLAGAKLASAAGDDYFVVGDISSTGKGICYY